MPPPARLGTGTMVIVAHEYIDAWIFLLYSVGAAQQSNMTE
jgi:hypothetical protein